MHTFIRYTRIHACIVYLYTHEHTVDARVCVCVCLSVFCCIHNARMNCVLITECICNNIFIGYMMSGTSRCRVIDITMYTSFVFFFIFTLLIFMMLLLALYVEAQELVRTREWCLSHWVSSPFRTIQFKHAHLLYCRHMRIIDSSCRNGFVREHRGDI